MREIFSVVLIAEAAVIAMTFAAFIFLAGVASDRSPPSCLAGSAAALFTNCEQLQ